MALGLVIFFPPTLLASIKFLHQLSQHMTKNRDFFLVKDNTAFDLMAEELKYPGENPIKIFSVEFYSFLESRN